MHEKVNGHSSYNCNRRTFARKRRLLRGGILFEIATDTPGFAHDESVETMGEEPYASSAI